MAPTYLSMSMAVRVDHVHHKCVPINVHGLCSCHISTPVMQAIHLLGVADAMTTTY